VHDASNARSSAQENNMVDTDGGFICLRALVAPVPDSKSKI
jgi:hypothetical protein